MIPDDLRKLLVRQHYQLVGDHSAVKTCEWLRKSLRGQGVCYKQQFYGVESHRCLQMTPAVSHCTQKCLFCWRPVEWTLGTELKEYDDPDYIVEGSIKAQRLLISGFGGFEGVDKKKYKEAQNPNQAAISLSGEPTIYPELGGLIESFHKNGFKTTYLVTNGTFPKVLSSLSREPTQLYLSLEASNEDLYERLDRPIIKDGWSRLNETIDLLPSLKARKVIRITLIRDWNLSDGLIPEFARIIGRAEPDFVECKSYMCIGYSRKRLTLDNMVRHEEILDFSKKLSEETGYKLKDSKEDSRVALLSNL
ncbi:MAG: 4-demethylwyosine synthase TYW1 [Candidatus Altiarchaeota archaeon]|nr:4-demethylwyosine synthase TYW1 [Candidatus Altiarchaeota archaeon]